MIIFPAIDLIDGKAVRLTKGEFDTAGKVADDPVSAALGFKECGADWIHIVDLDGARQGKPAHMELIEKMLKASGLKAQVGGGIRSLETIESYLKIGVARVILGSVAVNDPDFTREALARFGQAIAIGIDALDGIVKTGGWLEKSGSDYLDLAERMCDAGAGTIIYTDIDRDGTLTGPNLEELSRISKRVSSNIIASGGIRDINDINAINNMGLYGVIAGKAIYTGSLDLRAAICAVSNQ